MQFVYFVLRLDALLLCRLNEHAIIVNNLKDYLAYTDNLCKCDPNTYLSTFTTEERESIERSRQIESRLGKKTWYPFTLSILGRMVYAVSGL